MNLETFETEMGHSKDVIIRKFLIDGTIDAAAVFTEGLSDPKTISDFVSRSVVHFEDAKEIHVGDFFERVEVLVGAIWIITIFIKLSICFYAANLASAQLFRLKSYRATILPFGMLLVPLSLLTYDDSTEAARFIMGPYPIYSLFFGLFLPGLLLVTAKIRKLKSN
jgi:spore germination protein KB